MRCPKCSHVPFQFGLPCPICQFQGDPLLLEQLGHISYVLGEISAWVDVPRKHREDLREHYVRQRRAIERQLGLLPPILSETEAADIRLAIKQREYALRTIPAFFQPRGIEIPTEISNELNLQIKSLRQSLEDAPPSPLPSSEQLTLACYRFLVTSLDNWLAQGRLIETDKLSDARQAIQQSLANLESQQGIKPEAALPSSHLAEKDKETIPPPTTGTRIVSAPMQPAPTSTGVVSPPVKAPTASQPATPRQPWTWDRLWDTLVSERTLHAILFLGVALLVAAAVSLIVWNWNAFPPLVQVGILTIFTAIFYGLGWYVRVKLKLRGSGIALSAFASMLVPLEVYAIYLSGGFPRERWAEVWWAASLACLLAYILTTYLIQAEFFGYLVGLAGGSLVCASLQLLSVSIPWWQTGLALYTLMLGLAGELLFRRGPERWKVMASPWWLLSLTAGAVILPWNLALGLTRWQADVSFRLPLALTWWLGGLLFSFAAGRARSRTFSLAAALTYPLAVLISEAYLFPQAGLGWAWYAVGLALLALPYLDFGHSTSGEADKRISAEIATATGRLLVIVPAMWALFDVNAAALVHPILAVTVFLAARWWQQPRLIYAASLLLSTGSAGFVAGRGLSWGQIGLAWALLAIGLVLAGVWVSSSAPTTKTVNDLATDLPNTSGQVRARFQIALFGAGWLAALLSLLPPLILFDQGILAYTLGNWSVINGWLALLTHEGKINLRERRFVPRLAFQWIAAFSIPLWAWQVWLNGHPTWLPLPLVALLLAWALLGWGLLLRRIQDTYRKPWHLSANFCAAVATVLAFGQPQNWVAWLLLGSAVFFCAAAITQQETRLLWPSSLLFPLGLALALDLADLRPEAQPVMLALVTLAYLLTGQALERWRGWPRAFLLPIYRAIYLIGYAGLMLSLFFMLRFTLSHWRLLDAHLLWSAGTALLLGIVFTLRAWVQINRFDAYLATWLGAIACGLVALAYSHGTGRSAVLAALAAWGYILLERSITRYLRLRKRARMLFRWPLITSAWLIAAGTVGLVLIRNITWLGGRMPITWGVVALWLVVGLLAVSGRLYFGWSVAPRFMYAAGMLTYLPWSLMIWLIWPQYGQAEHAEGWAVLAALEWLIGSQLMAKAGWGQKRRLRQFAEPLQNLGQIVLPVALFLVIGGPADAASAAFGIGIIFYTACTWQDWRMNRAAPRSTFLYPSVFLTPLWACFMLANMFPEAKTTHYAALVLAFALPSLLIGYWLSHRQPGYRRPFYWMSYLILLPGTLLAADTAWGLAGALFLSTIIFALSAGLFRQPDWLYPSAVTLSGAWMIALDQWQVALDRMGWGLLALAAAFLLIAWLLRWMSERQPEHLHLNTYANPLIVSALVLTAFSLPPSSFDNVGMLVGYGAATALCAFCAFWLRQPIFLTPAVWLSLVAYDGLVGLLEPMDAGLILWPWTGSMLAAAIGLDRWRGGGQIFPWGKPWRWPVVLVAYLLDWWAFPFFIGAFAGAASSGLLSTSNQAGVVNWLLAGAVYGLAIKLFHRRFWLLMCASALQLAALEEILFLGDGGGSIGNLALYFSPVMWATLLVGLWLEDHLNEGAPRGFHTLKGWSRPLYLLVLINITLLQLASISDLQTASAWVTLSHTLAATLLAFWWGAQGLAYLALTGGLVALGQALLTQHADPLLWPLAYSLMAAACGVGGSLLRWARKYQSMSINGLKIAMVWEMPMLSVGWILSLLSLTLGGMLSVNILALVTRSLLGVPILDTESTHQVQMMVGVLAVQGIFYLTSALVERWRWLAYGAVALLLSAWSLEWLLVWGQREVQWYVVPAGLYLLIISYIEWRVGGPSGKAFARWLDRAAMLLLLGSVFWQSLGDHGGWYALLMGMECFLIIWWGSARRLRRFLYIGVAGMALDIFGQLIDPLLSVNRWIVFGVGGVILVTLAILIERRLETVMKMSAEVRKRLETWE